MSSSVTTTLASTTIAGSVEGNAGSAQVRIEDLGNRRYRILFADGHTLELDIVRQDPLLHQTSRLTLTVNGLRTTAHVSGDGRQQFTIDHAGSRRTLSSQPRKHRPAGHPPRSDFSATLLAPMPARVLEVMVKEQDVVEQNQPLLRIEAMKMVMTLTAPDQVRINALHIEQDAAILAGQLLITFDKVV